MGNDSYFGLTFHSTFPLLSSGSPTEELDVCISYDEISMDHFERADENEITSNQSVVHVQISGVGRFTIRDGGTIVIDANEDATSHELESYLLGAILGILLHQREAFVLHASAVVKNGRAVALLGRPTQGKSTLAGALIRDGWRLVADDKLVVETDEGAATVRSGPPVLKLAPETADKLGASFESVSPIGPTGKRFYRIPVTDRPRVPLSRLYLLEDSTGAPTIDPIPPAKRVGELMRNIYLPELVAEVGSIERHFEECATLARQVPVKRLTYPRRMDALPATYDTIEHDLAHDT